MRIISPPADSSLLVLESTDDHQFDLRQLIDNRGFTEGDLPFRFFTPKSLFFLETDFSDSVVTP